MKRPATLRAFVNTRAKVFKAQGIIMIHSWVIGTLGDQISISCSNSLESGDSIDVTLICLHSCLQFDGIVESVADGVANIIVPETVRMGPPQEPLRIRGIRASGRIMDSAGIYGDVSVIDIGPKGVGLNSACGFEPNEILQCALATENGLVDFDARVVYSKLQAQQSPGYKWRLGCEFVNISDANRMKWENLLISDID